MITIFGRKFAIDVQVNSSTQFYHSCGSGSGQKLDREMSAVDQNVALKTPACL